MYCYLPVFLLLYQSFRKDLNKDNKTKAFYISEYYLACRFVIITLGIRLDGHMR